MLSHQFQCTLWIVGKRNWGLVHVHDESFVVMRPHQLWVNNLHVIKCLLLCFVWMALTLVGTKTMCHSMGQDEMSRGVSTCRVQFLAKDMVTFCSLLCYHVN